jgi:hypothetical protein
MSGVGGDSGGYSGRWLLSAKGRTQQRLWSDESIFRLALKSREVFSVSRKLTVSHYLSCHSTSLGLANDHLLVPFLPKFANEDGFFGAVMGLSSPDAFMGHIPVAIFHDADVDRCYSTPKFRISDLLLALLIFSGPQCRGNAEMSCRVLGARLEHIAMLMPRDFWHVVHESAVRLRGEQIHAMEEAVKAGKGCPSYFSRFVEEVIKSTCSELSSSESVIPSEFMNHNSIEDAMRFTQEFVQMCGRMLYSWPTLLRYAGELRRNGQRLSRKVGFREST